MCLEHGLNSIKGTGETINELEGRTIKSIQSKQWKENRLKKITELQRPLKL